MQGRTRAVEVPPQHVWEGMAQYAPEAAELACHSLDIASAESYFARVSAPRGMVPAHDVPVCGWGTVSTSLTHSPIGNYEPRNDL